MPEVVPYGKRYWYNHMAEADRLIWERFMTQFPDVYDTVGYDVAVGTVPNHAQGPVVGEGPDMGRLYQRRIDVVGFKAEQIDIIEVKPQACRYSLLQLPRHS